MPCVSSTGPHGSTFKGTATGFVVYYDAMRIGRRTFLGFLGGACVAPAVRGVTASAGACEGCLPLLPPTGQRRLDGSLREGVFMDTGAGKPESGMFGNTRKFADGSPRFHEGIDIAPLPPWRRGEAPTDVVRAVAEGLVVYVNTYKYNTSLYGNYVVLMHTVPGFGEVYTLYGHLDRFAQGLKAGLRVRAGSPLGVMGNIPDIPMARAHLHFEIGICLNRYYPLIDPQHGIWNGANLYGINPCEAFREQAETGTFNFANYLRRKPVAFRVVVPSFCCTASHTPFLCGAQPGKQVGPVEIDFSAEGIPLAVRKPSAPVGQVTFFDRTELAKGRPFVKRTATGPRLTKRGETLIENLTVSPAQLPASATQMGEVG